MRVFPVYAVVSWVEVRTEGLNVLELNIAGTKHMWRIISM